MKVAGFVDIEASGIHPDSYPLKVSVCGLSGEPLYEAMIRPAHYWTHWDFDAQDLHGLEREILVACGLEYSTVAGELNTHFAGHVLLADANQDSFWMEVLFEAVPFEQAFVIANIHNHLPSELLKPFLSALPDKKAHKPMDDAIALRNAWYACGAGEIFLQNDASSRSASVETR